MHWRTLLTGLAHSAPLADNRKPTSAPDIQSGLLNRGEKSEPQLRSNALSPIPTRTRSPSDKDALSALAKTGRSTRRRWAAGKSQARSLKSTGWRVCFHTMRAVSDTNDISTSKTPQIKFQ
jgi:hypothetical protein